MAIRPEIDDMLLETAVENLGIPDDRKIDALSELRQLGIDSLLYRSRKVAQPWSNTLKNLKHLDNAATKLLNDLGGTGDLEGLEQMMATSPALAISVLNFAERVNPDRLKHSPLEDEITLKRLRSFLHDLKTFSEAVEAGRESVESKVDEGWGGHRHEGDWARWETSWHVLRLYYELTDKRPGVSKTEGAPPTGPAVRFLDTCLRAYGWQTRPNTAKNLIDQLKHDPELPWNITSDDQV